MEKYIIQKASVFYLLIEFYSWLLLQLTWSHHRPEHLKDCLANSCSSLVQHFSVKIRRRDRYKIKRAVSFFVEDVESFYEFRWISQERELLLNQPHGRINQIICLAIRLWKSTTLRILNHIYLSRWNIQQLDHTIWIDLFTCWTH